MWLRHFQVGFEEIDEMIQIVDRNGDGRISYSEFRWVDTLIEQHQNPETSYEKGDDGSVPSDHPEWSSDENENRRESYESYEVWKVIYHCVNQLTC